MVPQQPQRSSLADGRWAHQSTWASAPMSVPAGWGRPLGFSAALSAFVQPASLMTKGGTGGFLFGGAPVVAWLRLPALRHVIKTSNHITVDGVKCNAG